MVKFAWLAAGVLTGLALRAVSCYGGRALDRYAVHSLPPEWGGPKYTHWKNGVEQ